MPAGITYTLTNLEDDIKNYTEVSSSVFSSSVLSKLIINAESRKIFEFYSILLFNNLFLKEGSQHKILPLKKSILISSSEG